MNSRPGPASSPSNGVVTLLQLVLADECLLYTKVRHSYWTAANPDSQPLLQLFEAQYDELARLIDEIAERVRLLGGYAMGTMSDFLQYTRVNEEPARLPPSDTRMVNQLIEDHEAIVRTLRGDREACLAEYADADTGDFLACLVKRHETLTWRLRVHLAKAG
jgi:starvation-inducible DNA-binding protein